MGRRARRPTAPRRRCGRPARDNRPTVSVFWNSRATSGSGSASKTVSPPATTGGQPGIGAVLIRRGGGRQIDRESRADPQLALDGDEPTALLHHGEDGGEPEAGAVLRTLGGEERLEGARQHFRVHARAGVLDHHRDMWSGAHAVALGIRLFDLEHVHRDPQAPTAGHGIARIDRQVHDDLFELTRVRVHVHVRGPRGVHVHLNVRHQTSQHRLNLGRAARRASAAGAPVPASC